MPQTPPNPRPNTAVRWNEAYQRAVSDGLRSFNVAGDPATWFVTSANAVEAGYLVSIERGNHGCQCDAGAHGDPICKHRALVLHRLGMLPVVQAPAAPVADAFPFLMLPSGPSIPPQLAPQAEAETDNGPDLSELSAEDLA